MTYKQALIAMIKSHESSMVYDEWRSGDWFNPVEYDLNEKKLQERVKYWLKQDTKKDKNQ